MFRGQIFHKMYLSWKLSPKCKIFSPNGDNFEKSVSGSEIIRFFKSKRPLNFMKNVWLPLFGRAWDPAWCWQLSWLNQLVANLPYNWLYLGANEGYDEDLYHTLSNSTCKWSLGVSASYSLFVSFHWCLQDWRHQCLLHFYTREYCLASFQQDGNWL